MARRVPVDGVLFVLGVAVVAGTLAVSAVSAPGIATSGGTDEATLVGSQGGGPGWHRFGSVYRLEGRSEVWRVAGADSNFEVERLPDGRVVTGFVEGDAEDCGQYPTPCARTGFQVIDPATGAVDTGFSFPVRGMKNSEVHAAEPLPDGGFLVPDMEYERVLVVEDGRVTWQWNASSHYDPPPDPTLVDWLHINDVNVIGEGRYMVSVRNANQLLILERGEGVVEVINEDRGGSDASCRETGQLRDTDGDGEIRCGDPAVLDHQHNPHWLGDGAVLVADSENDRVVELHRTGNGWERVWTLTGAGGVGLDWPRDADRLPNGNTLVTDTLNRRLVEVDFRGRVVWSVRTGRIPYEADRLPAAESTGVPAADNATVGTPGTRGNGEVTGDLPVLSEGLFLLRAAFPWLPFWFRELQVVATAAGIAIAGVGVVYRYWPRRS